MIRNQRTTTASISSRNPKPKEYYYLTPQQSGRSTAKSKEKESMHIKQSAKLLCSSYKKDNTTVQQDKCLKDITR